jgi:hypothetical protein
MLLYADATGRDTPPLRIAQMSRAASVPAQWVALPFGPGSPAPDAPVTSIVVEAPSELESGQSFAGLVLDEWVEIVPRQRLLRADGDEPVREPPLLASGVAVHADAPGARPPQSILLALTPNGEPWSTQLLTDTLADTLALARLRGVTLERSSRLGWVLPAMLYPAFSVTGERILDFKALAELQTDVPLPFVKDSDGPEGTL